MSYLSSEVFGISTNVRSVSYVDRSNLDSRLQRLLRRDTHIALKGASKSGKSWLRQKVISNGLVIQCRYNMTADELYRSIADELGIGFELVCKSVTTFEADLEAAAKGKVPFITEASGKLSGSYAHGTEVERESTKTIHNLKYLAECIIEQEKKIIIEDFHYLSSECKQILAYDLKTLWDYGCYVVIVGVWSETNLLPYMNPDLTGRVEELSLSWSDEELLEVIKQGCNALNITITDDICQHLVQDSFGNVGVLQSLLIKLVEDIENIEKTCNPKQRISNLNNYFQAAKEYATQLDGIYQQFAKRLSDGMRKRNKSTGIYAYTMKAIVEASDDSLRNGYPRSEIFEVIHQEEERIQKGNLRAVLRKLEELQQNSYQGGLVIGYDDSSDVVFVVDLQLLFYRKHHTMNWPWESMVEEAQQDSLFDENDI